MTQGAAGGRGVEGDPVARRMRSGGHDLTFVEREIVKYRHILIACGALLAAPLGCAADQSPEPVFGTYHLQTIDGQSLPRFGITGATIELREDNTFTHTFRRINVPDDVYLGTFQPLDEGEIELHVTNTVPGLDYVLRHDRDELSHTTDGLVYLYRR